MTRSAMLQHLARCHAAPNAAAAQETNGQRGTKERMIGQHWLGLQKLLTCYFEPIGPIRRLKASIWSMFICFGEFFLTKSRFPKIGIDICSRAVVFSVVVVSLLVS